MAKVILQKNRCKACGYCVMFCPRQALEMSEDLNRHGFHYACVREQEKCTGCAVCGLVCPDVAIEVHK